MSIEATFSDSASFISWSKLFQALIVEAKKELKCISFAFLKL